MAIHGIFEMLMDMVTTGDKLKKLSEEVNRLGQTTRDLDRHLIRLEAFTEMREKQIF